MRRIKISIEQQKKFLNYQKNKKTEKRNFSENLYNSFKIITSIRKANP